MPSGRWCGRCIGLGTFCFFDRPHRSIISDLAGSDQPAIPVLLGPLSKLSPFGDVAISPAGNHTANVVEGGFYTGLGAFVDIHAARFLITASSSCASRKKSGALRVEPITEPPSGYPLVIQPARTRRFVGRDASHEQMGSSLKDNRGTAGQKAVPQRPADLSLLVSGSAEVRKSVPVWLGSTVLSMVRSRCA